MQLQRIKMEREHANFNKIKFTEEKLLTHTIIVLIIIENLLSINLEGKCIA